MKCAVHPEVDATGFCRNCGKALCSQCTRDVRGILYCETCLAEMLPKAAPATAGAPGCSPNRALWLGFIPGLGAVYNGEYTKALVHVLIFTAFIGALNSDLGDPIEPMLGILLSAFIIYMGIDARRVARARLAGQTPPATGMENWSSSRPIGPIVLIALGVFFLLGQHFPVGRLIREFWPVIFIAVGVLLLWRRVTGSGT